MTILRAASLALALLLLAACNRGGPEPASDQEPAKTTSSAEVSVSIDQEATERQGLKARLINATVDRHVQFSECIFIRSVDSLDDCIRFETRWDVPPPEGQKWLVAIVEIESSGREVSLPVTLIRVVDDSQKEYPLRGMPSFDPHSGSIFFWDLRDARFTAKPRIRVTKAGFTEILLFAIPANTKNVTLRLGASK